MRKRGAGSRTEGQRQKEDRGTERQKRETRTGQRGEKDGGKEQRHQGARKRTVRWSEKQGRGAGQKDKEKGEEEGRKDKGGTGNGTYAVKQSRTEKRGQGLRNRERDAGWYTETAKVSKTSDRQEDLVLTTHRSRCRFHGLKKCDVPQDKRMGE